MVAGLECVWDGGLWGCSPRPNEELEAKTCFYRVIAVYHSGGTCIVSVAQPRSLKQLRAFQTA